MSASSGAGFTGLWTAHALASADPTLRIAVVEKEVAGFGASGRNGGWCSALFATSDAALARLYGLDAMRAMRRAMQDDGRHRRRHGGRRRDRLPLRQGRDRRRRPHRRAAHRALAEIDEARSFGFGEDDLRWLGRAEAEAMIGMAGMLGATFTPHCAAIQPALLARGLADAVERRGVAHLRAHRGDRHRRRARRAARPSVRTGGGSGAGGRRRAGPRGAGRRPCPGTSADPGARVLAHGGHRAAGRRVLGRGRAATVAPPSPTTGT